jgi:hypothetical protein
MESEFQISLRSIGARAGLPDLSFDSAGRALLSVDDGRRVGIMLVPPSNSLILTMGVRPAGVDRDDLEELIASRRDQGALDGKPRGRKYCHCHKTSRAFSRILLLSEWSPGRRPQPSFTFNPTPQ